ncbi:MAG: L,D-transpeptidase family protein [Pseudomonadota bacterium]
MTPFDLVLTSRGLRFRGKTYPCTVGRAGLSDCKREGDGTTPRGIHRIIGMMYRPDRMARPTDWALPIYPGAGWSDDPNDEAYNMLIQTPYDASHEKLRRADPLYDLIILTDWNWPYAVPGRGSAIFIHSWRRPLSPTEGCIALSPVSLRRIAPKIRHRTRLIVP